ncbi:UvrD-helicase domain-containing protein [Candidatus Latescibacterota bacterium]
MPLSELDTDQSYAATCQGSEVAISAGAGSGKTRLLVGRYLHLIKNRSVPMSALVAITFTEKAAEQMKSEIAKKARKLADVNKSDRAFWLNTASGIHTAPISTIHAFCNSILRSYPLEAGVDPLFKILDDTTRLSLTREALNSFIKSRMEEDADTMDTLIRAFGISGLREIYTTLLSRRTEMTTYVDNIETGQLQDTENRYVQALKKRFENILYMLTEFHTVRPGDDALSIIIDDIVREMKKLMDLWQSNPAPEELALQFKRIIDMSSNIGNKGAKKKWSVSGISPQDVRGQLKECRTLCEVIHHFYQHETGITSHLACLLLREYELLEHHYLELKKSRSYLDHDDTLIETWRLLRNNAIVCRKVSQSYKHILIDELQDTDSIQMDILKMIAGNSDATLFTVGDPKQSIYRFRGADVTVYNEFIAQRNVEFKTLKKNYRSVPSIISFVNHTFSRIIGKDDPEDPFEARYTEMKPHRRDTYDVPTVELIVTEGDTLQHYTAESDFIARRAKELKKTYNYSFSDMALILRKSTQAHFYEEAFLSHNIPYVNLTSNNLFKSPEAYDCANLLGWLCEPNDPVLFTGLLMSPFCDIDPGDLNAIRVIAGSAEDMPKTFLYDDRLQMNPWLEDSDIGRIRDILLRLLSLRDRMTIMELLEFALNKTGYTLTLLADPVRGEVSLAMLDLILESADKFELGGGTMREFARMLSDQSLISEKTPNIETKDDALTIITIHKAKGLEYKVVFLADITCQIQSDTKPLVINNKLGIGFSKRDTSGKTVKSIVSRLHDAEKREKKLERAESKRLFYVGCTRAKDSLIISGKSPKKPDTMFEASNWMAWLHTALGISPDGELLPGCPANLFVYRRLSKTEINPSVSPVNIWKNALKKTKNKVSAEYLALEKLVKPVESIKFTGMPEHLSPTRIMDYAECPALYIYKHIYGLQALLKVKYEGKYGARYGSLAHSVLERWDFSATNDQSQLMEQVTGYSVNAAWKEHLGNQLSSFTGTSLYKDIRTAEKISRELPFAFLHDDVLIRGTIDLLFGSCHDLTVVDYKTENIKADKVKMVSQRFRLQIGVYGLAVYRAYDTVPLRLVIHYLAPGVSHEFLCTPDFLDEVSGEISGVIERMSKGDFSPKRGERCEFCPYRDLCVN